MILDIRSFLDFIYPTRHVLYITFIGQIAYYYKALLVPVKLLNCALYEMALRIKLNKLLVLS